MTKSSRLHLGLSKFFFLLSAFIFFGAVVDAQPNTSSSNHVRRVGKIVDDSSATPLAGVSVSLDHTPFTVLSDSLGIFAIANVPIAAYTVTFRLLGYQELQFLSYLPSAGDTMKIKLHSTKLASSLSSENCTEWVKRAIKDTSGASLVTIITGGIASPNKSQQVAMAAVTRRFGYVVSYGGCTIPVGCSTAYNEIINEWLDKRNGTGWREKLNVELEKVVEAKQ